MADRSARARKAARNQKAAKRGRSRPWWRRWWLLLLVFPALAVAAVGLLGFYLVSSTVPLPEDIVPQSSVLFDRDGQEVGGLASDVTREDVALADLPPHVSDAVLAAEDRRFYEHRGISLRGIARALFVNVRSRSVEQGGSTITQQYLKNAALTPEQTYRRKVEEAALAIKMEREYEKDEILEAYLNTIYWGRGASGIEAAAQTYFDVPASELDVNQAATLAGIISAPEAFDPIENPDGADQRRRYVLEGMAEIGALTGAQAEQLAADGLPSASQRQTLERGPNAYYIDAVRRELGALPQFAQGELFRGLRVFTQLDQDLQAAAQETLTEAVSANPVDTGAIVTVDPSTGAVRALVGGPDVETQPFNTAVRAVRQPGSTFKAFTLQAFVEAGFAPDSRFPAPPEIEIDDAQQPIRNYGGSSFGEQTVRQATASSTNTVFVQMQEQIGRESVIDAAGRAGLPRTKAGEPFSSERPDGDTMRPLAGLTLGQDSFSPLEIAAAYGTYAAEGITTTPHLVVRVEDAQGRIVYEPDRPAEQLVDVEVARTVTDVLRGVVTSGSGTAAALEDRPVAGKTGTTNDGRDVWFAGYVPQLATAVWLGNLDNSPIAADNATGGGLAAPVWSSYMTRAVEGLEVVDFTAPDLDDLETLNEEPDVCPEGYEFADAPSEVDEDGFFPDVLTDLRDEDDRPCVERKPELEPCPEGYEFADPPAPAEDGSEAPDVIEDRVDFQGRPCVEVVEAPEPDETDDGEGDGPDDGTDDGDEPTGGPGDEPTDDEPTDEPTDDTGDEPTDDPADDPAEDPAGDDPDDEPQDDGAEPLTTSEVPNGDALGTNRASP